MFYRKVSVFVKFWVFFKVISAEFSVEFSFSWSFLENFSSRLSLIFTFISWGAPFIKRVTKPICWLKFSCLYSSGLRIRTDGLNSSSKRGSHFLVPHCLGLLSPSPLRPNQVPHVVSLIFFININFYIETVLILLLIKLATWMNWF